MNTFAPPRLFSWLVAFPLTLMLCVLVDGRLAAETKRRTSPKIIVNRNADTPVRSRPNCSVISWPQDRKRDATNADKSVRITNNSIGVCLVPIEPGEFEMGSPDSEPGRHESETRHRVILRRGFSISVHEITQEQYRQVMGNNPSAFSSTGDFHDRVKDVDTSDFPVDSVAWPDAVEFCRRLSDLPAEKQAGRSYRLPTEAEWEYACRGGSRDIWHFGNEVAMLDEHAWNSRTTNRRTYAVGQKKPNPIGLYDMYGNVWEWCSDWYDPEYYSKSPELNPAGPETGSSRVIRGGGWFSKPAACRSASRRHDPPTIGDPDTGFRVVMEIDSTKKETGN